MKTNYSVKQQFDHLFKEKPEIEYSFNNPSQMGWKDRMIIKTLLNHGIEGKRCIDIGPGTGRWLQFFRIHNPAELSAIDISEESLKRCERICNQVQLADFEFDHFQFNDETFEIVVSFEVIEHLRNPDNYLTEVHRIMKKGGLFLMSCPNITSLISRIRVLFGLLPPAISMDNTHVSFYRQKDLKALLGSNNFTPTYIPTSISLNPRTPKSKLRIRSGSMLSTLDDSLLFAAMK